MSFLTGAIILGVAIIAGTMALALYLGRDTPQQRWRRNRERAEDNPEKRWQRDRERWQK